MRKPAAIVMLLANLALPFALSSGALAWLPEGVRLALAFAALVLLPGHALLAATRALPPGGPWLSSGWALGLGVAWMGLQVLATRMLGLPFTVLSPWAGATAALPWALALARANAGPKALASAADPGDDPVLSRAALAAVLLAALVAAVHCARLGTPVSYYTDSPDHIGTVRRMIAGGDAFPTDAFFRDAGAAGADPRKGLWHPIVALIAKTAGVDPLPAWRLLAALMAPLFVLNAAAFAFELGGSTAAAVGAWALLLTYGGSLAAPYLREAVFATKLADQLALATATAVLADLRLRSASSRAAAISLALGAVAAHVFASLQFAVVFGSLWVGVLVRDRGLSREAKRLFATALALGLACLPYLLWRARLSYAPNNVIHTEPQGLLTLWDGATIVSYGVLWDWLGTAWLLFPLSWWVWTKASRRTPVLYLLTTSLACASLMFCPPVVAILRPKLGYLTMRFVWLLPLAGALAFAVTESWKALRAGPALSRVRGGVALAGVVFLVHLPLLDAVHVLSRPQDVLAAQAKTSVERWKDALAWMDRELPKGSVVLSDPATSYSIPMMTRHWVATLVDQHSSPNDSLGLARILDARDALDPYATWERTREVTRRWGVTAIALNDRFAETPRLDYWAPSRGWYTLARARFDAHPEAFERVYDSGDFVVYAIRTAALDTLAAAPTPRPFVRPYDPARDTLAAAMGADLPELAGAHVEPAVVRAGDSVTVTLDWRAPRALPAGSYLVAVRVDRDMPADFSAPEWIEKPARKLYEISHGRLYRFRRDHLPVNGAYGPDLWRPGEVVRESAVLNLPRDLAPGEWRVEVRMLRQPHYPNYRLSDIFFHRDYYSGVKVSTLRVEAPSTPERGL
ncbi:MAG: hypothetical protein HZA61_16510 [Candidatus Eisenbacteria bacterium]|uniref:Uncharacterized protein n=1 Tax=Eiseniibacteriota bacterium TaxID=2212470 RepID=A0A933SG66_UNCEI|nr:hypothetical protein [Candidatus Eisenbacteria bacterium]